MVNGAVAKDKQDTDNIAMETNIPLFLAYPPPRFRHHEGLHISDRPEMAQNAIDHENSNEIRELENVSSDSNRGYDSDYTQNSNSGDHRQNGVGDGRDSDESNSRENTNENEKDDQAGLDPLLNPPPEHNFYDNAEPEATHFILPPVKQDLENAATNYDPEGLSGPTPPPTQTAPSQADLMPAGTKYIHIVKPRPPRGNAPIRYIFSNGINGLGGLGGLGNIGNIGNFGGTTEEEYSKGTTVHIPFLFPVNNIIVPGAGGPPQITSSLDSHTATTVGNFAEPMTTKPTTATRAPSRVPTPSRTRSISRPIARPSNLAGVRQYAPPGFYQPSYQPQAQPQVQQQYVYAQQSNPSPPLGPVQPQYAPAPQYQGPPPSNYAPAPAPIYEQTGPATFPPSNPYAAAPNPYAQAPGPPAVNYPAPPSPAYTRPVAQTYVNPSAYAAGPPAPPNQYAAAPPPSNYQTIRNPPPIEYTPQAYPPQTSSYHPVHNYAPQADVYPVGPPDTSYGEQYTSGAGPQGYGGTQTYVVAPQGNPGESPYGAGEPAYNVQAAPYPHYQQPGPVYGGPHVSASAPKGAKLIPFKGKVGSQANATKTIKYVTKSEYAKLIQQKKAGKYSGNR